MFDPVNITDPSMHVGLEPDELNGSPYVRSIFAYSGYTFLVDGIATDPECIIWAWEPRFKAECKWYSVWYGREGNRTTLKLPIPVRDLEKACQIWRQNRYDIPIWEFLEATFNA